MILKDGKSYVREVDLLEGLDGHTQSALLIAHSFSKLLNSDEVPMSKDAEKFFRGNLKRQMANLTEIEKHLDQLREAFNGGNVIREDGYY